MFVGCEQVWKRAAPRDDWKIYLAALLGGVEWRGRSRAALSSPLSKNYEERGFLFVVRVQPRDRALAFAPVLGARALAQTCALVVVLGGRACGLWRCGS